jgi:circadian clock protein KaiC
MTLVDDSIKDPLLRRFPTYVPGLDAILHGGLFHGGIYMLAGEPGAGKTLLANQICYGHVKAGHKALYMTLLSETHARMLAALHSMSFYDAKHLGNRMQYIGGYQTLETGRLEGLLKLVRKELRQHQATVLVLDGLVTAHSYADSDNELKRFIHELQVMLEMLGCTGLLLTGLMSDVAQYSQRTMVDGIFVLSAKRLGIRVVRELAVTKHRGSGHILGANFFDISTDGLNIHPRFEALSRVQQPRKVSIVPPLTSLGIKEMDVVLAGGVMCGSTTLLAGPVGFEKLLFGLKFLLRSPSDEEPGLYLTSSETPRLNATSAHGAASGLNDAVDKGRVSVMYMSSQEQTIDQIVMLLLDRIDTLQVKRLFINGLAVLRAAMVYPERSYDVFTALGRALQARGVTTMMTEEHAGGGGAIYQAPQLGSDVSGMVDYLLSIRFVTQKTGRHGLLTVVTAPNATDPFPLREFFITPKGVEVAPDSQSAQRIVSDAESIHQGGLGLA